MVCVLTGKELHALEELACRLESRSLTTESVALRNILREASQRREVRASVAAEVFHVTSETIRNWVGVGLLSGRIDEAGRVFVPLDALVPAIEMDAAMPYDGESAADVTDEEILAEIRAHRAEQRRKRQSVAQWGRHGGPASGGLGLQQPQGSDTHAQPLGLTPNLLVIRMLFEPGNNGILGIDSPV